MIVILAGMFPCHLQATEGASDLSFKQAPATMNRDWILRPGSATKILEEPMKWVQRRYDPDGLELGKSLLNDRQDKGLQTLQGQNDSLNAVGVASTELPVNPLPLSPKTTDKTLQVFISLSLPEAYLRGLFAFGAEHPEARFVLRGWIPPHLNNLQNAIGNLIPDPNHPPRVVIDPTQFTEHDVTQVPVFVLENGNSILRIEGEISGIGALNWFEGNRPLPSGPVGPLYDIEEPNILDEIQERLAHFDWKKEMDAARKRAREMRRGVPLPRTDRDKVYWVDISTVIQKDFSLPDGRVVVKAGSRVNPLDIVTVRHRYVFFDPEDESQINVVKDWLGEYNNLTLIATELSPFADRTDALIEDLGQMVFPANRLLVSRFQIHSVPALVEQDHGLLKVTVIKPAQGDPESPPMNPEELSK